MWAGGDAGVGGYGCQSLRFGSKDGVDDDPADSINIRVTHVRTSYIHVGVITVIVLEHLLVRLLINNY